MRRTGRVKEARAEDGDQRTAVSGLWEEEVGSAQKAVRTSEGHQEGAWYGYEEEGWRTERVANSVTCCKVAPGGWARE